MHELTNVFTGSPDKSSCYIEGIFSPLQHACHPVEGCIGIWSPYRFVHCWDNVIMFLSLPVIQQMWTLEVACTVKFHYFCRWKMGKARIQMHHKNFARTGILKLSILTWKIITLMVVLNIHYIPGVIIFAVSITMEHWFFISQFNPYMRDLKPVCNILLDGV